MALLGFRSHGNSFGRRIGHGRSVGRKEQVVVKDQIAGIAGRDLRET